ncbi:alpha/beta hydrolase [uncultured Rhodoblastus sp.]|uniref:alpha/beta fold hydrolase n=1 Tax=uncultured Rhodoblastus sp. TaxID=543037 RepID=UPI0025CF3D87|nr:alpha/beta hydrolase [uncultured Rhodoblastus sp.]
MKLEVDRCAVFASSGGKDHRPGQKLVVLLHGAGADHSVWALQSRWLAYHGVNVLAVDLPGHGRSDGPALTEIEALADWTSRLITATGAENAALVGHSMGALIALETAARFPGLIDRIALVGAAAEMPVHADLLAAAQANSPDAIAMVSLWGLGGPASLGGASAPGLWMLAGTQRLLELTAPGVLYADLAACDAYRAGTEAAARIACTATLILGERDLMTPLKSGKALAVLIPGARTVVSPGAGHMLMVERPDAVLDALAAWISAK